MSLSRRKKFMVTPAGGPNSDINVTPLVDVVLVLLIIFMVVTPLLEKEIDVRVPQTEEVETTSEVPQDQIVVGVAADGQITINNTVVELNVYRDEVKKLLDGKAEKDRLVFFMADDKANYGKIVAVLDQTKLAGATTLGMMTQIPEGTTPGVPEPGAVPGVPGEPGAPAPPTPPTPP